jgi:hypothetical protein
VPIGLGVLAFGPSEMNAMGIFYTTGPIWYGVLGFVFTGIIVVLYNLLARVVGGIEYTLVPVEAAGSATGQAAPASAQITSSSAAPALRSPTVSPAAPVPQAQSPSAPPASPDALVPPAPPPSAPPASSSADSPPTDVPGRWGG